MSAICLLRLPAALLLFTCCCSRVGAAQPAGSERRDHAKASFVALGTIDEVVDVLVEGLSAEPCLFEVRHDRDSVGVAVLGFADWCPGQSNTLTVRIVGVGDGTVRGTAESTYASASAGRSLALLPSDALERQEIPAFVVPVLDPGQEPCSTIDAWRAYNDAPVQLGEPKDTTLVEVEPVLAGGFDAFTRSVRYPEAARRASIEGRTVVRFVVGKEGAVTCADLMVDLSPDLNAEALRAVRAMQFTPGTQNGRRVPVRYTIPISFQIR